VPVREDTRVEVIIDGAEVFPKMLEAIEGAQRSVHIAGWCTDPGFAVVRTPSVRTLRDLLGQTAERVPVRVLVWGGPPVPVVEPTRRRIKTHQAQFRETTRVEYEIDVHERLMHCHHEKLVIVDDAVAFVGGLDFTDVEGDRFDAPGHPQADDLGWHDLAVRLEGSAVGDLSAHFARRWHAVTGRDLTELDDTERDDSGSSDSGSSDDRLVPVQILHTTANGVYGFKPDGEFTILAAYAQALAAAQRFIYLENQYLWSPELISIVMDKLEHPPNDDFRILLVLPRRPDNGNDTTNGQLARLIAADKRGGGGRLLATTLLGPTQDSPGVYVHAKVGIVDDAWLTIGSANLNAHSLFNDSETNVLTLDGELARSTRLRLWSEHTRLPEHELDGPVADVIERVWVAQSDLQDEISAAGLDPAHRIRRLAGLSRRRDRFRGPLLGLVVDG
jgi:phosphatidylserine/phosphatidylglycerophosphate/cardiolipin synthase-like enzyme